MQSEEDADFSVLWLDPLLYQELGEQAHDKACCEKSRDTVCTWVWGYGGGIRASQESTVVSPKKEF